MAGWYFLAQRTDQGRGVELIVHRGLRKGNPVPIGSLKFERVEWEGFRPIVIGAMRVAGLSRIPIDFMDQTRVREQDQQLVIPVSRKVH